MATRRYRVARAASASRAPSMGRASSGRATISESVPSKSRTIPPEPARARNGPRSVVEALGVVGAEVDRDLNRRIDVRALVEPSDDDLVELAEELVRDVLGLDLVRPGPPVQRGDRDLCRRVGRFLTGHEVEPLDQLVLRVAGEFTDSGA